MVAGSDRFWLCELRVSQHFSTFYGSSVQSMGTQLNALPALPVLARTVPGCLNSAFLGLLTAVGIKGPSRPTCSMPLLDPQPICSPRPDTGETALGRASG